MPGGILHDRSLANEAVRWHSGPMASLLHEYWENEDGGEFGVLSEHNDRARSTIAPRARFVFSLRASSWHEAMQMYQERLDYGAYQGAEVPDHFYTDEEEAEQQAYLAIRNGR